MGARRGGAERVLLIDPDPHHAAHLGGHLAEIQADVVALSEGDDIGAELRDASPTLAIVDAEARTPDGRRAVEVVREAGPDLPIIVMGDPDHAATFQRLFTLGHVFYIARHAEWPNFERTFHTVVAKREVEQTL